MNLVDEMFAVAAAFSAARIPYAVCGGIAVTVHGATRSTKDIDIVVARADLSAALAAIAPLGFTYPALPMVFDQGTVRERHVQRVSKLAGAEHVQLDLLLAEAAFTDVLDDRVELTLSGRPLAVVSLPTLLRMKRLAGRNQDLADIQRLETPDET